MKENSNFWAYIWYGLAIFTAAAMLISWITTGYLAENHFLSLATCCLLGKVNYVSKKHKD